MICSGCEDGFHDRCLDGQMLSSDKPWPIECDCASQGHDYKKIASKIEPSAKIGPTEGRKYEYCCEPMRKAKETLRKHGL